MDLSKLSKSDQFVSRKKFEDIFKKSLDELFPGYNFKVS